MAGESLNPGRLAEQNAEAHQQAMNQVTHLAAQGFASSMKAATDGWNMLLQAAASKAAQQILTPGVGARESDRVLDEDVPGEQVRIKGAQTTPPISSPGPVTGG